MKKDIAKYVKLSDTCKAVKAANVIQRAEMGKYRDACRSREIGFYSL